MDEVGRRTLVVIFGPPAAGKMAVGFELQRLTGLRLLHNHMTIDAVLPFFAFGDARFHRLVGEFRTRIFEEVAASELPGLIFTYVWALDDAHDRAFIEGLTAIFAAVGARVYYVELFATLGERLRRNETELRLEHKPPKRDLERSRANLLDIDRSYRLNSDGDFFYPEDHLRIDNTALTAEAAAYRIVRHFDLPRIVPGSQG